MEFKLIAITGSTGFIGGYVSDRLPFPQVRLIRKKSAAGNGQDVRCVIGDMGDDAILSDFLKNTSTLIHFAWSGSPRTAINEIQSQIALNLTPTMKLFQKYAELNPGGHIIFASTGGNMYGLFPQKDKFYESDPVNPLSCYSLLKLSAEESLPLFCHHYGISGTILRIANPYGVLLPGNRGQGIIGVAFAKMLAGESLELFDSSDAVRDYIHLEDVLSAVQAVIKNPTKINTCSLYNVGFSEGHSTIEVLNLIQSISRMDLKVIKNSSQIDNFSSPKKSILSIEKISRDLGWTPTYDLSKGLSKMWSSIQHG